MKVNKNVHSVVSQEASKELRLSAALGQTELANADKLTALVILTRDADVEIKKNAAATLKGFPPEELLTVLEGTLDPTIIKVIARIYKDKQAVLTRIAANKNTGNDTLLMLAKNASSKLTEVIAAQTERLRASKDIAIALNANPETTDATRELIKEFTGEETETCEDAPDDDHEEYGEIEDYDHESLYKTVSRMTVSEKMKLALKGNQEARTLLIKDSNKIVSSSVLKNPKVTEEEIMRLTASKGTSDDLLRQVARGKDWMKSATIKRNMVTNPKTPLSISMRLVRSLNKKDLEKISKSKNIPNALANEARKALMLKIKHG